MGSARHGHLESMQFLTSLASGYKKRAIWKKIARFSMGVNVWQLNKYMISNDIKLGGWYYKHYI